MGNGKRVPRGYGYPLWSPARGTAPELPWGAVVNIDRSRISRRSAPPRWPNCSGHQWFVYAHADEFPVAPIRVGRLLRWPTRPVLIALGLIDPPVQEGARLALEGGPRERMEKRPREGGRFDDLRPGRSEKSYTRSRAGCVPLGLLDAMDEGRWSRRASDLELVSRLLQRAARFTAIEEEMAA